jgi:uncharacterized protein (UPF0332 family)
MEKSIAWHMGKGLLNKSPSIRKLVSRFLAKARNNVVTMSILFDLQNNSEARSILHVPDNYNSSEWVVVCGYYAMYMAASAALARIDYQSKNHSATILVLEKFFVKKELLELEYLEMIEKAQLETEHVEQLRLARNKREIAQYSVTEQTTKLIAGQIKADAYKFVERMERLIMSMK